MNLALPALVVFLLVVPGFVFRARWKTIERTSLDYAPFSATVVSGLLYAAVLHGVWMPVAYLVFDKVPDIRAVVGLLSSDSKLQEYGIGVLEKQQLYVGAYVGSQLLLAYVGAPALRTFLIARRWHLHQHHWFLWIFYFDGAPWYQLLKGRWLVDGEASVDLVFVTAVVDVAGTPILYRGFVSQFFCNPDGSLDRLVLEDTHRRAFSRDKTPGMEGDERFYPIAGDLFVLRYSEAVTLNIGVVRLEGLDEGFTEDDPIETIELVDVLDDDAGTDLTSR